MKAKTLAKTLVIILCKETISRRHSNTFPFNVLLLPLSIVEWVLRLQVTSTYAGS